ncbi:MFS general substrate transporter [Ramaria rubella]|nr:MFS general substrate transporter [Ramaria rubella]
MSKESEQVHEPNDLQRRPFHDNSDTIGQLTLDRVDRTENVPIGHGTDPERCSFEKNPKAIPQYSVWNTRQKWFLIALAALAGLFSPLTANSYFPAIQTIADAFHTSVELINVTVTVYMVFQGISPMFWGTLSDRLGRRPLFLTCLALLAVSCMGVALVPTDAYWLLLVLRCFQAAGSASTIALGSGVIGDISEPSERGGFLGIFSLGPLVGPCVGPIIGGVLAGSLGWRSIFWFLTISAGVYFIIFFLLFPETLRVIVGNGSITPPPWNRPLIPILSKTGPSDSVALPPPKKFINPLRQFTHPSVVLVLVFNGTVYSVFYGVTTTLSDLFAKAYPFLTESELGLCFLSVGIGCAVGSYMIGKLLDADFKRIERALERKAAEADAKEGLDRKGRKEVVQAGTLKADFPIEYARLRAIPIYLALFVAATTGYGWAIQSRVHLSCPLILQFIIGVTISCMMNTSQTLLMDLFPMQSSSITAANNLVRCTMGATLVSIIDFIINAIRPGWTYTLLSGICVLMLPMNFAVIRFGPKWRESRREK